MVARTSRRPTTTFSSTRKAPLSSWVPLRGLLLLLWRRRRFRSSSSVWLRKQRARQRTRKRRKKTPQGDLGDLGDLRHRRDTGGSRESPESPVDLGPPRWRSRSRGRNRNLPSIAGSRTGPKGSRTRKKTLPLKGFSSTVGRSRSLRRTGQKIGRRQSLPQQSGSRRFQQKLLRGSSAFRDRTGEGDFFGQGFSDPKDVSPWMFPPPEVSPRNSRHGFWMVSKIGSCQGILGGLRLQQG